MTESTPRHTARPEEPAPAPRPHGVDLTLLPRLDADGRPIAPTPPFPDLGRGARLVLYPVRTGLAVDWDLAELDARDALATFPDYLPPPRPSIRLCRINQGGPLEIITQAAIPALDDGADADPRGRHRFVQPDGHGQFQAELGLTTPGGGWVLVLRSNRIAIGTDRPPLLRPARNVRGADGDGTSTSRPETVPPPIREASPAAAATAAESSIATARDRPEPSASVPRHTEPQIDEIATSANGSSAWELSPSSAGHRGGRPNVTAPRAEPTNSPAIATIPPGRPPTPDLPGRIHAVRYLADGRVLIGADRNRAPSIPDLQAAPGQPADERREADEASPEAASSPEGAASASTGPETSASPGEDTLATLHQDRQPTAGSGPITDHRNADAIGLTAELIISGHAPPGTLLDLGGHPYRVGPGGRFQLRIPVPEHDRIMAMLRQLPGLPVDERD
jgi:hypothetical protein